jgi:hypothetical protein
VAKSPRLRREDYTTQELKMIRGLSRWQLPILTVADRGGARLFQCLAYHKSATVERAMRPLVRSDRGNRYGTLAMMASITHRHGASHHLHIKQ